MVEYIKEDIQEVMAITGLDYAKSEKLFNEVVKDIDDGSDDELNSFDIIDIIKTEKLVKDTGSDKRYGVSKEKLTDKKEDKPTIQTKRERKKDFEKREIIQKTFNFLKDFVENAEITKEEKEIIFKIGENDYTISLTKHRKPKK
nr:MAG TPA: hypothetical protein [Caudoviricetes sp.]